MSKLLRGVLLAAVALSAFSASDAFGTPAVGRRALSPTAGSVRSTTALSSALFRDGRRRGRSMSPTTPRFMTGGEGEKNPKADVEAAASEAPSTENSDDDERKEGSGLVTALLLGPPLFAKFVIVLVVKFLTDLVVFPLLFLYRLARLAKNKVLGLFGEDEEKPNGESSVASS